MTDPTVQLLQRWHAGDRQALDQLMSETLPWLQSAVGPAITGPMRRTEDSGDFAHSAVVKFLMHGPRFLPANQVQFRALMKRIAMNEIIDRQRRLRRVQEGDRGDSQSTYGDSVLDLTGAAESSLQPSRAAAKEEDVAWIRLALELLADEDRQLVYARTVEERNWASIAEEFGMPSEETARARFTRLMPRLAILIRKVRAGGLQELISSSPVDADS